VITHPSAIRYCAKRRRGWRVGRNRDAYSDHGSILTDRFGKAARDTTWTGCQGIGACAGEDAHDTEHRPPGSITPHAILTEKVGEEAAELLSSRIGRHHSRDSVMSMTSAVAPGGSKKWFSSGLASARLVSSLRKLGQNGQILQRCSISLTSCPLRFAAHAAHDSCRYGLGKRIAEANVVRLCE